MHDIQLKGKTDQTIMTAEQLQRYCPQQQKDINLVRLHLQVHILVAEDLTDPKQPNAILLHMMDGKRNPKTPISSLWPRQSEPTSNTQRRLWKRFISSSYLRYIPYWKQNPTTPQNQREHPPGKQSSNPALTLDDRIRQRPRSQRRLLDSLTQVATDDTLWKAFRSRKRIHIASDGGLSSSKIGTFGWTIATNKETLYYTLFGTSRWPSRYIINSERTQWIRLGTPFPHHSSKNMGNKTSMQI